jgi:hypothetical protein
MTGQELIDNVASVLNLTATKGSVITECLFWANAVQKDMYIKGDWAELIIRDAALTADGSKSYDLRTAITSVVNFGRLREQSIRFNNGIVPPKDISFIDSSDPDQSQTGDPDVFAMVGYKFVPWPFPGSGDFKLDYVTTPVNITQAMAESEITFSPENHEIIFEGMLYFGMRRYGVKDWVTQFQIYSGLRDTALKRSGKVKHSPKSVVVNPY